MSRAMLPLLEQLQLIEEEECRCGHRRGEHAPSVEDLARLLLKQPEAAVGLVGHAFCRTCIGGSFIWELDGPPNGRGELCRGKPDMCSRFTWKPPQEA
jgi:hypothetical protein